MATLTSIYGFTADDRWSPLYDDVMRTGIAV